MGEVMATPGGSGVGTLVRTRRRAPILDGSRGGGQPALYSFDLKETPFVLSVDPAILRILPQVCL